MRIDNMRKLGVVAWPVVAAALILGACGSDAQGSATASTIDLKPTEYITKAPVPTTTTLPGQTEAADAQMYTVQSGDFPIKVAEQFGVPVESLLNYNNITAAEWPFPGEVIKIPPGGTPSGASSSETTGDTIPEAGDNCAPGKYVLVAGDNPSKVANKFDVTLEALRQANVNTPGFTSFVVGTEIVIPAKADC